MWKKRNFCILHGASAKSPLRNCKRMEGYMSKKIIVIGGVALGPKAANRLKRLAPDAEVTMIDEKTNISFGGCGIPYFVSGEINSLDALRSTNYGTVRTPAYFEGKGIHTLNRTRVLSIDPKAHTVQTRNVDTGKEQTLTYDRLVLATGSTPRVPPVEGRELSGVTGANNLEEADAIRQACASGKISKAVIVGGGFIGMEMAVALADMWGVRTSVVEFMPQVMPGVLSASYADAVAHDLQQNDVAVYTSEKVLRLEGKDGAVTRVVTDQRTIDADLVIFATGYAPNSQLAREAGLDIDPKNGGILVNEFMQTSDPDIYAGGDCVSIPHLLTGKRFVLALGSLANRQGRVIGTNLASAGGQQVQFAGAVGTWCVKLFKLSACGTGLTIERAKAEGFDAVSANIEQLDRAHFYPEKDMMSLELVVERGTRRVLGLQGLCVNGDALKARIDAVATMLQFGKPTLDDLANAEIAYAPPFASAMDALNAVANVADDVLSGQLNGISSREFSSLWEHRAENNIYFADARPAAAARATEAAHPGEWHAFPLEEKEALTAQLPQDRPIALVCNTGLRSYEVLLHLKQHGFTNVTNAMGGMQTLIKRGRGM